MGICFSDEGKDEKAVGGDKFGSSRRRLEGTDALALLFGWRGQSSDLELSISCKDLVDPEMIVHSDAMAVVYHLNDAEEWEEVGRTEVVERTQSPQFVTQLRVFFRFEQNQRLLFRIYDLDDAQDPYDGRDTKLIDLDTKVVLGEGQQLVPNILTAPGQSLTWRLTKGHLSAKASNLGSITVKAEEVSRGHHLATLKLRAAGLQKRDLFSKSDPFVRISRQREDASWAPVFKTEVAINDQNPSWNPIKITTQQLCQGNQDAHVQFEVFDFDLHGKHPLLGTAEASVNELQAGVGSHGWDLVRPRRKSDPDGPTKMSGRFYVDECAITERPTFLDFVFGGCQLSFMVAIDFTASNGDPNIPGTLHYRDPSGQPNAYQQAIRAVGDVLQFYDYDKRFPAWGFGGKRADGPVSHCFALNGDPDRPEVDGVEGILAAYEAAICTWGLAGPTLFHPVVEAGRSVASQFVSQQTQKYFVLLILTDGTITDLDDTVDSLVAASDLPLTVNILGIGDGNFERMEILDGDKKTLEDAEGNEALRDFVNFLPMRELASADAVAQKMLAGLPGQLLEFMAIHGFTPNRRDERLQQTQVANRMETAAARGREEGAGVQ